MSTQRFDPPAYFKAVRKASSQRWNQLEGDPELAGPWLQLFKQVQNPRHVLSELLQNADDAGASEASVRIEDGVFLFEHDGEDFNEEQFRSLCRFGFSNKRNLHTIGFRGIGFKSTFSLGDTVQVHSPTLSLCFHRRRFTEPHWLGQRSSSTGKTSIRVAIEDEQRRRQLEQNLDEWRRSSLSLLFFKNLRRLQVGGVRVAWHRVGDGPVPGSEYLQLEESQDSPFLIVRSAPEPFPAEALDEIRQERMLADDEGVNFPPATLEIVLGPKNGGLYVVLPAGVETPLPFACNAPFIQDPARLKIKDPSTSPTNRWLLERAGRLAADAMMTWLRQVSLTVSERAAAYDLLPDVDRDSRSLEGSCAARAELAFAARVESQDLVVTDTNSLVNAGQAIALPPEILQVWSPRQVSALFDDRMRPALSRHVLKENRQKLENWRWVDVVDQQRVIAGLESRHVPRPETWHQLLSLWSYVAPAVIRNSWSNIGLSLCIVPVAGKEVLYSATQSVRIGDKNTLETQEDWDFLGQHLCIIDNAWLQFLNAYQRDAAERQDGHATSLCDAALSLLTKIGLETNSAFIKVIDRVATGLASNGSGQTADWVRLAHLAAKTKATVGANFRYVTRDQEVQSSSHDVFVDADGWIEYVIPKARHQAHLLHPLYTDAFYSCSPQEWRTWVSSENSRLHELPRPRKLAKSIWGRDAIREEIRRRGGRPEFLFPYQSDNFMFEDWDFERDYWIHWQSNSENDPEFWSVIFEKIMRKGDRFWGEARSASAFQISRNYSSQKLNSSALLPAWLLRFRELPCLRTTRGTFDKPRNLLRLVSATRAVVGVEEFVHDDLDREANHALLDLLGVRTTPTGPDQLLERVRALASSESPPVHELEKWYRQLDQMMATCQPADAKKIKDAFQGEKLILTETGEWATAGAVFRSLGEDDIPGTTIVRPSVASLALWQKVGVAERPTVDLVINWLKTLPSGQKLAPGDLARVEALVERHGIRIWEESGHWLNLADEWVQTTTLRFALTRQSLPWSHLENWVKQQTADLRRVPSTVAMQEPFSELPVLAMRLQDRLVDVPQTQGHPSERPWLTTFATELRRFEGASDDETVRVRELARRVLATRWHQVSDLKMAPYIDGVPAGRARSVDVLWLEHRLYTKSGLARAKLAWSVPEEIARPFRVPEIKAALDYSFERSSDLIRDYLNENMKLSDPAKIIEDPVASTDDEVTDNNGSTRESGTEPTVIIVEPLEPMGERYGLVDLEQSVHPDESDAGPTSAEHRRSKQRATTPSRVGPSLIERFAVASGYEKESVDRYVNAWDGSRIEKTKDDRFPWVKTTSSGDVACYYWPRECCIDSTPLELEADLWLLLDSKPKQYALILVDVNGNPEVFTGTSLRSLIDERRLNLYTANYRLVMSR